MANQFYDAYRNSIFGLHIHSAIDFDTDDIRVVLYDEGADALNLADQDLADIAGGAQIAVSNILDSPTIGTVAVGTYDHADEVLSSVSGATVESLIYYKHTGTSSTSPLAWNIDSWTGLPLTPNGGNVTLAPHANGVVQQAGV
jgi:hypothetical protein